MLIVHLIGSDEDSPFKIFTYEKDAISFAEREAAGAVDRVLVYEWAGDIKDGLAAAKAGQLLPKMNYAHRDTARVSPPEPAIRFPKGMQDIAKAIVDKMPRTAQKYTK